MELLTGKCKDAFEKWYWRNYADCHYNDWKGFLHVSTFSMQYGVFVDFFDSVDINIIDGLYGYSIKTSDLNMNEKFNINSRAEARKAAIEKANELYNQKP